MLDRDLDRINRAEEIQRYTENRCEALEKENAELREKWLQATDEGTSWARLKSLENRNTELEEQNKKLLESCAGAAMMYEHLTKAKEFLKWFVWYFREGCPDHVPYKHNLEAAEQFLEESK